MLTCCNPSDWRWPLELLTTLQSYFITPLTTFCFMMAFSKSLTSWSRGLQKLQNSNLVTFSWGRRLTALNGISTHSWSENCLTNLFEHRLFVPRLCQGLWLQFRFKTPPSCWEVWHGTPILGRPCTFIRVGRVRPSDVHTYPPKSVSNLGTNVRTYPSKKRTHLKLSYIPS